MTYQFSVNNTCTSGTDALYNLKELMKTHGWTVPSSSDGTTFSGSSDIITSGNTGAGGLGNTNAWIVLTQPSAVLGSTRQICLQNLSSGGNGTIRITYSYTGNLTGGSASTTPSSADVKTIYNTTLFASPAPNRYNMMVNDASPYEFYIFTFPTSSTSNISTIVFSSIISYPVEELDPYVFYVKNSGGSPTSFQYEDVIGANFPAWMGKGNSRETFLNIAGMAPTLRNVTNSKVIGNLEVNHVTGNDDILPIFCGFPSYGIKGIISIIFWAASTRTSYDTFSVNSTKDFIILRACILPWSGVDPVLT